MENLHTSISKIIFNTIKLQNKLLLENVSNYLQLSKEEEIELFANFYKSEFFVPKIIISKKKEQLQQYM